MKTARTFWLFFFFCWTAILCAQENQEQNWNIFRGPGGLGLHPGSPLPPHWDASAYRWEVSLPGVGHSSPVAWDERIFVTSAIDSLQKGFVVAINAADGSKMWEKELELSELNLHVDNNLASATPAVDATQLYVVWYAKDKISLLALSHEGEIRWQSEFEGIHARHGGGSSLVLTEKAVIFTREQEEDSSFTGSWMAVDKRNGQTLWEIQRTASRRNSFSTPLLVENDQGRKLLLFTSEAHGFTLVDSEDGKILEESPGLLTHRVVASPIFAEGLIVGCRKGETVVLEADLDSFKLSEQALYTLPPNLSPYVPTPLVKGELLFLFLDNGSVACVKLRSGELLWKERPAGPLYGSPVCIGDMLFCITKNGEVLVIQASEKYNRWGINDLGEGSYSTPIMCKHGMVFRSFTTLRLLPPGLHPNPQKP